MRLAGGGVSLLLLVLSAAPQMTVAATTTSDPQLCISMAQLFGFGVFLLLQGSLFSRHGNMMTGCYVLCWLCGTTQGQLSAELELYKAVEVVPPATVDSLTSRVRFSSYVWHNYSTSTLDAVNVTLEDGDQMFTVFFSEAFIGPLPSDPNFIVRNDAEIEWMNPLLALGENMTLSYLAEPIADRMPYDPIWLKSKITYYYTGGPEVVLRDEVCVYREDAVNESLVYQYGFTVLGLFIGLITGALIVILILFIIFKVRRKTPFDGAIRPVTTNETKQGWNKTKTQAVQKVGRGGGLVTSAKQGNNRDVNDLMNLGSSSHEESILYILAMNDKLKAFRAIDSLDIGSTARTDQQLETERNEAMLHATRLLILTLVKNGDITPAIRDKALSALHKKMDKLHKDCQEDLRKEMDVTLNRISNQNKEKLGDLVDKHDEEKEALEEKTAHMDRKDKEELLELLKKQQETEKNELTFRLELGQKEALEKLRKEGVIRRRMALKTLQQETLDDIRDNGKLSSEQADWLLKEHLKNQAVIEKLYDDEVSRQRMILEEKLARRRALAENKDMQEDADSAVLNQLAEQQTEVIMKAKKLDALSSQEARAMIEEAQKQMLAIKNKVDSERQRAEGTLQKKLSERKKQRMDELTKQQKQETQDLEKKQTETQTGKGYVDPIALIQSQQVMAAHHRTQQDELENEVDKDDALEYAKLREEYTTQTQTEIQDKKDELVYNLGSQGVSEAKLKKILERHKVEQLQLQTLQTKQRTKQMARFKEQFSNQKAAWQQRQLEEQAEQQNLREHEDDIVRKLMDNQVALSEQEREKIMQEHEKQMVTIENSLTLNKLQQQRMLEEKLAKRRQQQLEKLQKKHNKDAKKRGREDEEDELDMLKRQAEDRISVIRGETLQIGDEMEEIQSALLKERANALKEQEVKLGAMLAQLQMEKAKEMTRIEEQQKAINNLKSNLMDDLHEKGQLTDPECKRIIDMHQKDQEKLNHKLETQKAKQEKVLQQRLQDRLRQKEKQLSRLQGQEMEETEARKTGGSTAAGKLRRAALATKHMVQMEKFRNRMESEISQTLQEMKRQNEMQRLKALQDQEIQFINGLVRLGKFRPEELQNVVSVLFPNKSPAERQAIIDRLVEGATPEKTSGKFGKSKPKSEDSPDEPLSNTLEERVVANTLACVEQQTTSTGPLKGKKLKKRGMSSVDDLEYAGLRRSARPDPVGRLSPEGYDEMGHNKPRYSHIPPSHLPPLETAKPKKKKKNPLQTSYEADF